MRQRLDKLPDSEPAGGNIPSRCEGRDFDHYAGKATIVAASLIDDRRENPRVDGLGPLSLTILIDRLSPYNGSQLATNSTSNGADGLSALVLMRLGFSHGGLESARGIG